MSQTWQDLSNGYYVNPELSSKNRMIAALQTMFNEAVDPPGEFSIAKKSGEKVAFRLTGRISGTAETPLTETQRIPLVSVPEYEGLATAYRYGRGVLWTGQREDLDRLDVESSYIKALREHAARTRNKLIYDQAVTARSFTFTATSSTAGNFTTNGTPSGTTAATPTLAHLRILAKELSTNNMPTYDGKHYLCLCDPDFYYQLLDDTADQGFVDVAKYGSGGADGLLRNEVGKAAGFRFIVDNDAFEQDGADRFGEALIFGAEAMKNIQVYPVELRANLNVGGDFGNQKAIAWQSFEGFKSLWNFTTHGQGSICHVVDSST